MHNKAMQVTNQMFVRLGYEVEIYPDPEPAEAQDEGEPLEEGLMRPSADVGTKRLPIGRMRSLMILVGMFSTTSGCLEGSDDPGKIFTKHKKLAQLMSILSLFPLQGCTATFGSTDDGGTSWIIWVFTNVLQEG